jgi:hypothetical protein
VTSTTVTSTTTTSTTTAPTTTTMPCGQTGPGPTCGGDCPQGQTCIPYILVEESGCRCVTAEQCTVDTGCFSESRDSCSNVSDCPPGFTNCLPGGICFRPFCDATCECPSGTTCLLIQ